MPILARVNTQFVTRELFQSPVIHPSSPIRLMEPKTICKYFVKIFLWLTAVNR